MVAMMFIIFLVLLLIGVPIAFSLGLSSLFSMRAKALSFSLGESKQKKRTIPALRRHRY